jgi:hypothetical protein
MKGQAINCSQADAQDTTEQGQDAQYVLARQKNDDCCSPLKGFQR